MKASSTKGAGTSRLGRVGKRRCKVGARCGGSVGARSNNPGTQGDVDDATQ